MGQKEVRADMRIPMPCRFGEKADCNGKALLFKGVSWFKWSWGMDYTYFFAIDDKWHETKMYTSRNQDAPFEINIPDSLLIDKPIKEHGYPLKGSGYAHGVYYADEKMYIDFIMTSSYFAHIRAQCNEKFYYVPNGDIIFPPSWDTAEKKEGAILKSYSPILNKAEVKKEAENVQLSIFDFINS